MRLFTVNPNPGESAGKSPWPWVVCASESEADGVNTIVNALEMDCDEVCIGREVLSFLEFAKRFQTPDFVIAEHQDKPDQSVASDLRECTDAFEAAGFRRPPCTFTKYDIRGSEYGHWEIGLCDSDNIKVRYYNCDENSHGHQFEIVFKTLDDFRNWARVTV